MARSWLLGAVAVVTACSSGDGTRPSEIPTSYSPPPQEPPTRKTITLSNPEPATPAGPTAPPRPPWEAGQKVRVRGTESNKPWLKLMVSVPGKHAEYVDLEDGGQTVIYVTRFPKCPGQLEVEGVVLEVMGPSKRPGNPAFEAEAEEQYSELHIDVSRYRCL